MNNGISFGALLGLLGVVFGAFGAHALKGSLEPEVLISYQTGIRFQMYHAIVLLILGFAKQQNPSLKLNVLVQLFTIGTVFFSFSIYLLSLDDLWTNLSFNWLGPVTPLGGTILIIAWAMLFIRAMNWARLKN